MFREHYGRAVAVLIRLLGDIGAAEEAVQDAFLTAVSGGRPRVPPSPAGWIVTTARNRRSTGSAGRRPAPTSTPRWHGSPPTPSRRRSDPCRTTGCA